MGDPMEDDGSTEMIAMLEDRIMANEAATKFYEHKVRKGLAWRIHLLVEELTQGPWSNRSTPGPAQVPRNAKSS